MRNTLRVILAIPMMVGWVLGLLISPLVTGFIAGVNFGERLIDRLDEG